MFVPARLIQLANIAPKPPVRTQEHALSALCWGMAAMAFVSLNPYFMWEHQKIYYSITSLLVITSVLFCWRLLSFSNRRIALMLGFSLFLIYLSFLPKMAGGTTRWFLLIPFTVALLAIHRKEMDKTFGIFYWMFALSLIPGMLLWMWAAAGLPIEFRWMTPPSAIIQRGVIDYFMVPGAVVLPSNAKLLPDGGVVFRLCGVYDEPGTVGTIAALCLAATRFHLRSIKGAIVFTAGLMSLSLAFAIIVTTGLLVFSVAGRKPSLVSAALVTMLMGTIVAGLVPLNYQITGTPNIVVIDPRINIEKSGEKTNSDLAQFGLDKETRPRFSPSFDNRAQPKMRQLLTTYLSSPVTTILFGIASDASHQTDGSSVWFMLLTNYGVVGFLWLLFLYAAPLVLLWNRGKLDFATIVFCTLYLMSFYQRPIVWLPAQLCIYMAGVFYLSQKVREKTSATPTPSLSK